MVLTPCSGCHPRACPNDIRTSWDGEARLLPHPTLSSRHPMSGLIGLVAPAVAAEDAKAIGPCRALTPLGPGDRPRDASCACTGEAESPFRPPSSAPAPIGRAQL